MDVLRHDWSSSQRLSMGDLSRHERHISPPRRCWKAPAASSGCYYPVAAGRGISDPRGGIGPLARRPGLATFPGCVVVISHDRWFLDRITTHILAFEGDSQVRFFAGNVTDYENFRHKELGTAADQPHRIRYKRLAAA